MKSRQDHADQDFHIRLKWLIFFRILFASLLLGSTLVLQFGETEPVWDQALVFLYGLIAVIFGLSILYLALYKRIRNVSTLAYWQVAIDTVAVTWVIYLTGSFSSLFSFLYLVVIIYASMLLFRKGSMIMAALSSIQYGILVDLEYYGVLKPLGAEAAVAISGQPWSYVLYKVMIIMVACFAVAFLSGFLAEQARASKKELRAMETHLKRVEKMAAVGEMAAGLAHEIKNPLASLRGSIQILKDDLHYDPDHEKLMQIILREADRLSSLINNFLMFARPPAGRIECFELGKAIIETIDIFKKNSLAKDIAIVPDIESNIWVEMDPGHLRQVLWNLLLNAAEAIEESGRIDITLTAQKEKFARILIRDTGCGIPPDALPAIFDPFFTTKPKGTGLGLSIVLRIIESYDGMIHAESQADVGSTFSIRLKRVAQPENADARDTELNSIHQ